MEPSRMRYPLSNQGEYAEEVNSDSSRIVPRYKIPWPRPFLGNVINPIGNNFFPSALSVHHHIGKYSASGHIKSYQRISKQ
jgi:hypothetical protein